jgi:DNA polymerase III delta subunit/DNA polymerase I-like protein with 3'-5' exonuclease and polymerase domains
MIYLLTGNDSYSIDLEVKRIKNKYLTGFEDINYTETHSIIEANSISRELPFGSQSRIVVIKSKFNKDDEVERPASMNILVIVVEGQLNKFLKVLKKDSDVVSNEFNLINSWDSREIRANLRKLATEYKVKMDNDAIDLMVKRVGNDSARLHSELNRLSLFDRVIDIQTINKTVVNTQTSAFDLVEFVLEDNVQTIYLLNHCLSISKPMDIVGAMIYKLKELLYSLTNPYFLKVSEKKLNFLSNKAKKYGITKLALLYRELVNCQNDLIIVKDKDLRIMECVVNMVEKIRTNYSSIDRTIKLDSEKKDKNNKDDRDKEESKSNKVHKPKGSDESYKFKLKEFNSYLIKDNLDFNYQKLLNELIKTNELVIDLETFGESNDKYGGLHPWKSKIRLIQLGIGESIYVVDLGAREEAQLNLFSIGSVGRDIQKENFNKLINLLKIKIEDNNTKIIGHNVKFDLLKLAIEFNIKSPRNVWDTLLGSKCVIGYYGTNESGNQKRNQALFRFSLESCVGKFLGEIINKTEQKSDWGSPLLTDSQINYAIDDIKWTYNLFNKLYLIATNRIEFKYYYDGSYDLWVLENNCIAPAITMSLNGIPLDKIKLKEQISKVNEIIDNDILVKWREICPDINPTQKQKLITFVSDKYNIHLDKWDKESLADHKNNPLVDLSIKHTSLLSYLKDLKAFQSAEFVLNDGLIHTDYNTLTGTGRFSSGNNKLKDIPNLHAIGAKSNNYINEQCGLPLVRECIVAPDGYKMIILDLSAAHARIAAQWCNDKTAIIAQNDETIDTHSKVAVYVSQAFERHDLDWQTISKLCGKFVYLDSNGKPLPKNLHHTHPDYIDAKGHPDSGFAKTCRNIAKNTYYGWLNGAGAKRTKVTLKSQFGMDVQLEACQAALDGCREIYQDIEPSRNKFMNTINQKIFTMNTDIGSRHIAPVYIDLVNTVILFEAVTDFNDSNKYVAPYTQVLASIWSRTIINYVHDEFNLLAPEELASEVAKEVKDIMSFNFSSIIKDVLPGFPNDHNEFICKSWADK